MYIFIIYNWVNTVCISCSLLLHVFIMSELNKELKWSEWMMWLTFCPCERSTSGAEIRFFSFDCGDWTTHSEEETWICPAVDTMWKISFTFLLSQLLWRSLLVSLCPVSPHVCGWSSQRGQWLWISHLTQREWPCCSVCSLLICCGERCTDNPRSCRALALESWGRYWEWWGPVVCRSTWTHNTTHWHLLLECDTWD